MKAHPHSTSGSQHERDQLGPSGQGSVMIDIGPGRGALGEYQLYGPDTPPRPVSIDDGAITELRW
jgi:hypothetical protein